ncbi:hypothetical protein QOZ80_3AG0251260 [Eleusine coracana subsp. coracana]|nr:hypothetical protein QOZ80_3AG0251260 [Eleusine coracana subsp. coracana]
MTAESPAIRKLGQLFRITEVHLWDDSYAAGANEGHRHWRSADCGLVGSHADKMRNKASKDTDEGHSFVEDLELVNLMGSLGLPVSFSTSKVHKKTANKGKKKGIQAPVEEANTQINDDVRTCVNTEHRESDILSVTVLEHSSSCCSSESALGYSKPCCDDTDKILREGSLCVEEHEEPGCDIVCSVEKATACVADNKPELGKLPNNTGNLVKPESPVQENQASDIVVQCSEEMLGHADNDIDHVACPSSVEPFSVDGHVLSSDSNFYYDYGDWRVIWDPFYSRYYFYNIQSQESTWCPPEGLEDFDSYSSTDATKELDELGSQSTSTAIQENCQAGDDRYLDGQGQDHCRELHDLSKIPGEEQINQSMITTGHEVPHDGKKQNDHSCQDMTDNISSDIIKYWTQRYSLFSLFDSGIKMDEEGVGGNAIQFASKCKHVIAVDIDPQKIDCAQHNASIYGVNDHIDFVVGDFLCIAPHLKGGTAFMSPPWGGPDYTKVDSYDVKVMLKPCDGHSLFKLGTMIAPRIVMFLPRNIDLNQLADMALSVDPPWTVEVEKNFLNGKLKAITAYFVKQDGLGVQ